MNAAVRAHCERRAERFLAWLRTDRNGNQFLGRASFDETDAFFYGNLIERVHGHFNVGGLDVCLIVFDADLDVVVDHPFDGDHDLHAHTFFGSHFSFRAFLRCGTVANIRCLSPFCQIPEIALESADFRIGAQTCQPPGGQKDSAIKASRRITAKA